MTDPLDEQYFNWLCGQIFQSVNTKRSTKTHWSLARHLFTKEFVWLVPNDDNRAEDGLDLRIEFIQEKQLDDVDESWLDMGCSMLEMMISLSRRLTFQSDGETRQWFWALLENLRLDQYNDRAYPAHKEEIERVLDVVIWRTYAPDGTGGLFPLKHPSRPQPKVELWYQFCEYILENE